MIRDKEIQELQNEIADLQRKESGAARSLVKANETIRTSTELGDVERALVTAHAAVAVRNNVVVRVAGIEKKIDDLRNDQEAFRRDLKSAVRLRQCGLPKPRNLERSLVIDSRGVQF